jgi:hypothetical protein
MNRKKYLNSIAVLFIIFACSITQFAQGTYPKMTESQMVLQGDKGKWDDSKVHTFSIVEANKDGYKYWGYYGLSHYGGDPSVRNAGLVRSNDLVKWEKYDGNPIVKGDCRWPSVVYANKTFYMFYAEYNSDNDSRIVMVSSKDGIHFGDKVEVVARETGKQNQNPNIVFNKKDKCFYLSYYHGLERDIVGKDGKNLKKFWQIAIKKSKNINGLQKAAPKTLLSADYTLASPSIAYYNNKYYLIVEASLAGKWDDKWVTLGYECDKIDGKYKEVSNSPVLSNNDACAFQHIFNNDLYIFYSHCLNLDKWEWELRMVKSTK